MTQHYKTNQGIRNAKSASRKLLKVFYAALVSIVLTANSYGQCITGGNNTETVAYSSSNVTNEDNAVDADVTGTAAHLNVPILIGSSTIAINFSKPVNPGDSIHVIIGQASGLNISLFSSFSATAYTGKATASDPSVGTNVSTTSGGGLLSLLFIGGVPYQTLTLAVNQDATTGASSVAITASAFVSLNYTVNVYGVTVVPGPPIGIDKTVCFPSGIATLQAQKYTLAGSTIDMQWYKANDTLASDLVQTDKTKSGSPYTSNYTTPSAITSTTNYYVRQSTAGCGLYSALEQVTASVNPQILAPITAQCTGTGTNPRVTKLTVAPSGGSGTLASVAWTLTNGATVIANGTTANPTIGSNGTYTATVTDSKGCSKTQSIIISGYSTTSCAVVLPALGFELSGSIITGKPVLTWSTLQEVNTSYFSIEASTKGVDYTALGKVAAAGTSMVPSTYTFTDITSTSAVVYYRVKLVDIDGGVSYSNVFSLRLSGSSLAKIYPNPVTNFVNIETGAAGTYVAELFTVDGRKLTSTSLSTASGLVTLTINRSNVTSGAYLLKVTNKATATSTYNTIMVK